MEAPEGHQDGADRALATVAAAQHGAFSCRQATDAGLTAKMRRTRRESGRWDTLHRGVYRVGGDPATWHQSLTAPAWPQDRARWPRTDPQERCGGSTGWSQDGSK